MIMKLELIIEQKNTIYGRRQYESKNRYELGQIN